MIIHITYSFLLWKLCRGVTRILVWCFDRDQMQHEASWTVVWRRWKSLFKHRSVMLNFKTKEMTESPRNPQHPNSIGITLHVYPFSTQSSCSDTYQFFFRSRASFMFSSKGKVSSVRKTLFEWDHITSGRLSVRATSTGHCKDVIRSTETFQSLAPISSFLLDVVCFFFTGLLPSLWNWILVPFLSSNHLLLKIGFLSNFWSPLIHYYVAPRYI